MSAGIYGYQEIRRSLEMLVHHPESLLLKPYHIFLNFTYLLCISPWACPPAFLSSMKIPLPRLSWILKLSHEGLAGWMQNSNKWSLQFDGASKINPGVEGGGRILINLEGIIEYRFSRGLGKKKNNQEDAYGMYLDLTLA